MSTMKIKGDIQVTGSSATFPATTTIGGNQASTTTGSETLTNKTLTSPVINTPTGIVKGDVGLGNVDNTSDANKPVSTATQTALNGKENTITATTSADYYRGDKTFQPLNKAAVGLGNVDNTSDATKNSASATLTNKTIDAASNTISNISNSEIKAAAAIDASKIADGSVSNTEFQYLDGVTSSIQTQISGKISSSEKGANNGVATLDAGGKVPATQLPNSVMTYEGTFDASATPATPLLNGDSAANAGMVYLVSVAGSYNFGAGAITFAVGDWAVYNGSIWQKSINSNAVVSVNGQTGVVSLTKSDVSLGNVDNVQQLPMSYLDTDNTLAANSDTKVPSQKAIKSYVDSVAAAMPTGDINPTSFSASGSVSTPANVTGLAFANASVTGFRALVTVKNATAGLYEVFTLEGIQKASSWDMSVTSTGDDSTVAFSITTAGQIQYVNANSNGATIRFRANAL